MKLILEYDEVHSRLLTTRTVQAQIAAQWTWEEKTLVQWDTLTTTLDASKATFDEAEAAEALALGALTKASIALHEATKQAVGLIKVRFRDTPETLKAFANLRAVKASLSAVRQSADDLAAAWQKADPTGSYAGVTLADYNALRTEFAAKERARVAMQGTTKQARQDFTAQKTVAHKACVAWYGAATRVFPLGTETGTLLRAQIPT
jgi:hypothetical protein